MNAYNRTTTITYPDGAVVTRAYTDRNQLAAVTHTPFGGSAAAIIDRLYDSAGRLTQTTVGNSLVETRTYTPASHLVAEIAIPGVTDFTYVYDANRRKTQEANGILPAQTQTFIYDDQDRLTGWERPVVSDVQAWTLSLVGDWDSTTRNSVTETRTHTDVHELTGRTIGANPAIPLGYDAKGNLSDDGEGRVYAWDPENRLQTARVSSAASPTTFGLVATYQYDALGRRVAKTINGTTTRFLSAGAQVVEERDAPAIPPQAMIDGADSDGTAANAELTPASGGILEDSATIRVNFQPLTTLIPVGYYADKGKTYAMRTNALTYGWDVTKTSDTLSRNGAVPVAELDTLILMEPSTTAHVWEIALPNGTYPVIVVAGDPLSTEQTNDLQIENQSVTDPDPSATATYTQGDFDGYAVLATVTDGKLTISMRVSGDNAKLCFVEIGPEGTAISSGALDRLAALIAQATDQTAHTPPASTAQRQYVYGTYVDELLSYTVGATRYFTHANHLYSIAATTNAGGSVVERYAYDAYGTQTVTNAAGTVELAESGVSQTRGFTGRYHDAETGLMYYRTRAYSVTLGRFINRMPWFSQGNVRISNYSMAVLSSARRAYIGNVLERSHGAYLQGRMSLYDFVRQSPGNYVEPFSSADTVPTCEEDITVAGPGTLFVGEDINAQGDIGDVLLQILEELNDDCCLKKLVLAGHGSLGDESENNYRGVRIGEDPAQMGKKGIQNKKHGKNPQGDPGLQGQNWIGTESGGDPTASTVAFFSGLKSKWCPDCEIEIYSCNAGLGATGQAMIQGLANLTGCKVTAPKGEVGACGLTFTDFAEATPEPKK